MVRGASGRHINELPVVAIRIVFAYPICLKVRLRDYEDVQASNRLSGTLLSSNLMKLSKLVHSNPWTGVPSKRSLTKCCLEGVCQT